MIPSLYNNLPSKNIQPHPVPTTYNNNKYIRNSSSNNIMGKENNLNRI